MKTNDEKWKEFNQQLIEHAKKFDWGLYRNTRLEMYYLLKEEGNDLECLRTLLEICYLDINGPRNCGGILDPVILDEFPPWEEDLGWFAPKLIKWINDLRLQLNYTQDELYNVYRKISDIRYKNMNLPVHPEKGWEKLRKELQI